MVRYGMIWYGITWNGMDWHGMVWHSMTWHGIWYAAATIHKKRVFHIIVGKNKAEERAELTVNMHGLSWTTMSATKVLPLPSSSHGICSIVFRWTKVTTSALKADGMSATSSFSL